MMGIPWLFPVAALLAATLAAPARAGDGRLVTGVSYSNRYGTTGDIGLEAQGLFHGTTAAHLRYRGGEKGGEWDAGFELRHDLGDTFIGTGSDLHFGFAAIGSDWKVNPYQTTVQEFSLGIGAELGPDLHWKAGLFHRADRLNNAATGISPLIAVDLGASRLSGIEVEIAYGTYAGNDPLETGQALRLGFAKTLSPNDSRNWTSLSLRGDSSFAAIGQTVLHLGLGAGVITPDNSANHVHVVDRVFSGADLPRGFGWGSTGPVDPATGDVLGGTRYVGGTIELIAPLPRQGMAASLFADAGSIWDIGPLAGTSVDDGFDLRASGGVSLIWATEHGQLKASLAKPVSYKASDKLEQFSLLFTANF